MRLPDFIEANTEPILAEWVAFAAESGPAGKAMDVAALRDHAVPMLRRIVSDLRTPQAATEQADKAKGNADSGPGNAETPAAAHGAVRAASGFTLGEMMSEYRALRASVTRLWTKTCGSLAGDDLEDLVRFNEAIDQASAESIRRFVQDLDQSKEMFLAILGHDLRTPLGAIIMSSQFMLDTADLKEPHLTLTRRIGSSARRLNQMVGDLLDFARGRFGAGVPIVRGEMEMGTVARQAVEEMRAASPDSVVQVATSGDLRGQWDAARISQVLANLLGNALQHGSAKTPVSLTVEGHAKEVVLRVHNSGPAIPPSNLPGLFSPLKRLGSGKAPTRDSSSLGLGLYIAEQIVTAHGGTIDVESSDAAGTTFTVHLPR